MKTCPACRSEKPLSDFYKDRLAKDGLKKKCKACVNADCKRWVTANRDKVRAGERRRRANHKARFRGYALKKEYGLTLADYQEMEHRQDGRCAICQEIPTPARNRVGLYVDHNHHTGTVRALLCQDCNTGIGHLQDSPALLHRAAEYLQSFQ